MATKLKRAKKARAAKASPDTQRKIMALMDKIISQRQLVKCAEDDVESAKQERKAADKALESEIQNLTALIDEVEAIRDGRPFQQSLPLDGSTNGHAGGSKLAIKMLGLTESMTDKLIGSEIETITDLEKAMSDGRVVPNRIKGIGQKAVDTITDALMKFRADNPIDEAKAAKPAEEAKTP